MSDDLISRYSAWLRNDDPADGEDFFKNALVVLDANILLSLYELTPTARSQFFAALEQVKERLWLPYQVGLELIRGRHRVIIDRKDSLNTASQEISTEIQKAGQAVMAARGVVLHVLDRYKRDATAIAGIEERLNRELIDGELGKWRRLLTEEIRTLRREISGEADPSDDVDPILSKVAELYGTRVAPPTPGDVVRRRVQDAITYRYPNKIPPGFADLGKKTDIDAAGDYLLWEEIIEQAKRIKGPRKVLFVTSDTRKGDWYEPAGLGRPSRPWPSLSEELMQRSGAELRIESSNTFFGGVNQYYRRVVDDSILREIDRASFDAQISLAEGDGAANPNAQYAVVDVETTSMSPGNGEIIELAIALVDSAGVLIDQWDTLVKPENGVRLSHIHGISETMVADAPRFSQIARHLHALLAGRIVVAHNLSFDSGFLQFEFARAGIPLPHISQGICTLVLSRKYLPASGYRLASCCRYANVDLPESNEASSSVAAVARLLGYFIGRRVLPIAQSVPDAPDLVIREDQMRQIFGLARSGDSVLRFSDLGSTVLLQQFFEASNCL